MKTTINNLLAREYLLALYVDDKGTVWWLVKHYRYLSLNEMLKHKVPLGKTEKGLKLKPGLNYITEKL